MNIYTSDKPAPYVYMCWHKNTKEIYIGYREKNTLPSNLDIVRYRTSSKLVKYRFEEFEWMIIAEFTDGNAAFDFEQQLIAEHWGNPLLLNGYCHKAGKRFKRNFQTAETRRKISEKAKGRNHSSEIRSKISAATKGKPKSELTRSRMRKPKSESHRQAMKDGAKLRHPMSTATKIKMSEAKKNMDTEARRMWIESMTVHRRGIVTAYDLDEGKVVKVNKHDFDKYKNVKYVGLNSKLRKK